MTGLERRKHRTSVEEILALARRVSGQVMRPYLSHGELLYDEHGLPR